MKDKHQIVIDFTEMIIEEIKPQIIRMVSNYLKKGHFEPTGIEEEMSKIIGPYDAVGTTLDELCKLIPQHSKTTIAKTLSSMGFTIKPVFRDGKTLRIYQFKIIAK